MQVIKSTVHELSARLRAGEITAPEIAAAFAARTKEVDPQYRAFVPRDPQAEDRLPCPDAELPIPIGIKDNICVRGMETTCCSRILAGFRPPYDATVIERLRAKGLILAGHTNMDEFAFGSSTENSCYGPTRNPWNPDHVPGGSSGGSAAAVAAQEVPWALGSDTGGSIRQPASFCGVVGVKPTYGRVSRYGLIAFASSLDQIGPITRDVRDAARLLQIIAGYDRRDSTSVDVPVPDYAQALNADIKGLRIGIPKEYFIDGLDPEVRAATTAAVEVMRSLGATVHEISLPHTGYCVATYYIIATAEASSNLARYDGVRYGLRALPAETRKGRIVDMFEETREKGFGAECKRRIMLGTFSLSSGYYDAYYLRGQKVRTLIKQDFDQAFQAVDAIVTPTAPTTAFRIGEKADDPLNMYLSDVYTISANLSGIPALSLPCGFDKSGLPIGLQILCRPFDEAMMFRVAYQYEQQAGWFKRMVD